MFFYTVSFPSAVWCLSRMPWSWVPDIYFARENLLRTYVSLGLQCCAESKERARRREAERKRPSLTVAPLQRCTHPPLQFPPRRTFSWNQQKSAPSGGFCAARNGRHSQATFISTRMPGAWTRPVLAPRPATDRRSWKKAYAPVFLRNTSCNSNDKVITET